MPTSFLQLLPETLEEILLVALEQSPLGPPTLLHTLFLTCRQLYHTLLYNVHPTFYAQIFARRFDFVDPHRHLKIRELLPKHLSDELRVHCMALQCFRKVAKEDSYDDPRLPEAFRTAYLMLLGDKGKNFAQLSWAGLPDLILTFLRRRLYPHASVNNGWPEENEGNCLAVAIFWLMTSSSTVNGESSKFRDELRNFLAPCTFAAFRYPCFGVSEYRFHSSDPIAHHKTMFMSVHGSYPPSRLPPINITYFGQSVTFNPPTLASFAILSYFVRAEMSPIQVPSNLPRTRADAIAAGLQGPTQDDVIHFNECCKTRFVRSSEEDVRDTASKGRRHDPDWFRAIQYPRPSAGLLSRQGIHPPGTFTGRWQGSCITPCMFRYYTILGDLTYDSSFYKQMASARQPLYITFREHYCFTPAIPVPLQDDENSFKNSFLPLGCQLAEVEGGVNITNETHSFNSFYETYKAEPVADGDIPTDTRDGQFSLDARFFGAVDIIITGETGHERAQAWGAYKYIGRIRPSDGLIILLREPLHQDMAELGKAIFRGYLTSSQNLVGRWRNVASPDWEAIFSICKE